MTPSGPAIHDGGISAVARDLARFGRLLLETAGSTAARWSPRAGWRTRGTGPRRPGRVRASDNEEVLPGGWYRNQFWFVPTPRGAMLCLGIHGQMVYVNRATRLVGVKLSSWPEAQSPEHLANTLRACGAISARLAD